MQSDRCDSATLAALADSIRRGDGDALSQVERALDSYPNDSRLSFLRGSLLAAAERYAEAIREMSESINLDPDYQIARFQLGLLRATTHDVEGALEVWDPLWSLERDNPLAMFAFGLSQLFRGHLADAARMLTAGIVLNQGFPALSDDMKRVVDRIEHRSEQLTNPSAEPAAHLLISEYLLGQYRSH